MSTFSPDGGLRSRNAAARSLSPLTQGAESGAPKRAVPVPEPGRLTRSHSERRAAIEAAAKADGAVARGRHRTGGGSPMRRRSEVTPSTRKAARRRSGHGPALRRESAHASTTAGSMSPLAGGGGVDDDGDGGFSAAIARSNGRHASSHRHYDARGRSRSRSNDSRKSGKKSPVSHTRIVDGEVVHSALLRQGGHRVRRRSGVGEMVKLEPVGVGTLSGAVLPKDPVEVALTEPTPPNRALPQPKPVLGGAAAAGGAPSPLSQVKAMEASLARADDAMAAFASHAEPTREEILEQWMQSYDREGGEFKSVALECELAMKRASLMDGALGDKHELVTAVAFECLDKMCAVFGRYAGLMRRLRHVFVQAVFADAVPDLPEPEQRSSAGSTTAVETVPYVPMQVYFQANSYFGLDLSKKKESADRQEAEDRAKDATQRAEEVTAGATKAKVVDRLRRASYTGLAARLHTEVKVKDGEILHLKKALAATETLDKRRVLALLQDLHESERGQFFTDLFGSITAEDRQTALVELLNACPFALAVPALATYVARKENGSHLTELISMAVRAGTITPNSVAHVAGDTVELALHVLDGKAQDLLIDHVRGMIGRTVHAGGGSTPSERLVRRNSGRGEPRDRAVQTRAVGGVSLADALRGGPSTSAGGGQRRASRTIKLGGNYYRGTDGTAAHAARAGGPTGTGGGDGGNGGGGGDAGGDGNKQTAEATAGGAGGDGDDGAEAARDGGDSDGGDDGGSAVKHPSPKLEMTVLGLQPAPPMSPMGVQLVHEAEEGEGEADAEDDPLAFARAQVDMMSDISCSELMTLLALKLGASGVKKATQMLLHLRDESEGLSAAVAEYDARGRTSASGGAGGATPQAAGGGAAPSGEVSAEAMAELARASAEAKRAEAKRRRLEILNRHSLASYQARPKKGTKKLKFSLANVLALIADCYEKKIAADATSDAHGEQRQPLGEFLKDYFIHRYGFPTMADGYLHGMVDATMKYHERSPRLHLFGIMCGVVPPPGWVPTEENDGVHDDTACHRLIDVVLHLYSRWFPKFSSAILRRRREGALLIALDTAQAGVEHVFTEEPLQVSCDRLRLEPERRAELQAAIHAAAKRFEDARDTSVVSRKSSEGEDGFFPHSLVVDSDWLMQLCVDTWMAQIRTDMANLELLYKVYDEDESGTLSYAELKRLLHQGCGISTDDLPPRKLLSVYKKMQKLSAVEDVGEERESDDCVTATAFTQVCTRLGYVADPTQIATAASQQHLKRRDAAETRRLSVVAYELPGESPGATDAPAVADGEESLAGSTPTAAAAISPTSAGATAAGDSAAGDTAAAAGPGS